MKHKEILLPIQVECDNRQLFSFAMEFAKYSNTRITPVVTYTIPVNTAVSSVAYHEIVERIKIKIHLEILDLAGYYQCFFNRWNSANSVMIKSKILHGSMEEGLLSLLKVHSCGLILMNKELLKSMDITVILNTLSHSTIEILTIPAKPLNPFIDILSNDENLELKQNGEFESLLSQLEFYNMPNDINLLRQHALMAG